MDVELVQFLYSPYNEKARWALDWKGIAHRRTSLLPGPHLPRVRRLTGGAATTTPLLRLGGEVIQGSAHILDELERRWPEPPLAPASAGARDRAAEIERRFDEELTPRIRRAVLHAMLSDLAYVAAVFAADAAPRTRALYRLSLPIGARVIAYANGIRGEHTVADGVAATAEALDRVAELAGQGGGHLVGERFSRADLVAASHLAPAVDPPHPDMERPRPRPAAVERWLARWVDHPGRSWVLETYRQHRPSRAPARRARA